VVGLPGTLNPDTTKISLPAGVITGDPTAVLEQGAGLDSTGTTDTYNDSVKWYWWTNMGAFNPTGATAVYSDSHRAGFGLFAMEKNFTNSKCYFQYNKDSSSLVPAGSLDCPASKPWYVGLQGDATFSDGVAGAPDQPINPLLDYDFNKQLWKDYGVFVNSFDGQ
jgi:hypothetical protein